MKVLVLLHSFNPFHYNLISASTSHSFRRGTAFTMEVACSAEMRTWAMSHTAASGIYINIFKAQTSTVNIQALMHDIETRYVLNRSSMSLGRAENASMALSAAGEDKVMLTPRVREASSECDEALDAPTMKFSSVQAAKDARSSEYQRWREACEKLRGIKRHERDIELKREYQAYRDSYCVLSDPKVSEAIDLDGYNRRQRGEMFQSNRTETSEHKEHDTIVFSDHFRAEETEMGPSPSTHCSSPTKSSPWWPTEMWIRPMQPALKALGSTDPKGGMDTSGEEITCLIYYQQGP